MTGLALAAAIAVGAWLVSSLSVLLLDLLAAWLIAVSAEPVVARMQKRGIPRGLAVTGLLTGILIALGAFGFLLGAALGEQVTALINAAPDILESAATSANENLGTNLPTKDLTAEQLGLDTLDPSALWGTSLTLLSSVAGALFNALTVMVVAIYMLTGAPELKRIIAGFMPAERQQHLLLIWETSEQKAGAFVASKVALAGISAVAHCCAFAIIGVPYWLPMGIFAGVISQFIPVIGTYVGVLVPALFALTQSPADALWVLGFAIIYQQIENYILTPRIAGKTMDLNPGLALVSVVAGTMLLGPVGARIGMPLAAIAVAVVREYAKVHELHPQLEDTPGRGKQNPSS